MAQSVRSETAKCAYVVGDDGLAQWSDIHADAWIGLLETHKRLTRAFDAELEAQHGLTLSAAEVLGRLAAAPERRLRLSTLAGETRPEPQPDLAHRRCARGPRARRAAVVPLRRPRGRGASHRRRPRARPPAQACHFASVQERFFDQLSPDEIETLAEVFCRFAPRAAESLRRLPPHRVPEPRCAWLVIASASC